MAAVLSMSCHAQLGNFPQAETCLRQTREYYAQHLKLIGYQRRRFLDEGLFLDDLLPIGDREAGENPWLFLLLLHDPVLPKGYVGATEAERQNNALRAWAQFIDHNREQLYRALAHLYTLQKRYIEAEKLFARSVLVSRPLEGLSPIDIRLIWPRVAMGDCQWQIGQRGRAVKSWRSARSFELCLGKNDLQTGSYEHFAVPWIERAKSRLREQSCEIPTPQASREAGTQLYQACLHLLEAEEFESEDEGLLDRVHQAGKTYTRLLDQACNELAQVDRLDPFTWVKVPIGDASYWFHYEKAKHLFHQKMALTQCAHEEAAQAISSCRQAIEIWPTLSMLAMMGGLQAACGLINDARLTYQTCIDRAEELGAVEPNEQREQTLREVRQALANLPSQVSGTNPSGQTRPKSPLGQSVDRVANGLDISAVGSVNNRLPTEESDRKILALRLHDEAMLSWSRDPDNGEYYCTSLQQAQQAREQLVQALDLEFDEPQLRAQLEKSLRTVNSMEKRVFTGNWFMVIVLGLFYLVPGVLWWYVNRRPRYLINRDSLTAKQGSAARMGGIMGRIYSFCEEQGEWGWLFGLVVMFTVGIMLSPVFMILAYKENYIDAKQS